jgi:hypothetical protein
MFKNALLSLTVTSMMLTGIHATATEKAPAPPTLESSKTPSLQRQAGIGSPVAFAEAGVLEMGGSFSTSTAEDYNEASVSPMIGYFIADNIQVSALVNASYVKVGEEESRSVGSMIAEPSLHVPMTRTTFIFGGIGFGALFQKGAETGFAVAPRVGYKNLVGRSGMLTLSLQPVFGINDQEVQSVGGTVVTVSQAYNMGLGYTVLF